MEPFHGEFQWNQLLATRDHQQCSSGGTGLAYAFLSLSPQWHRAFLLPLFLSLPQGLSIFEHLGGGVYDPSQMY